MRTDGIDTALQALREGRPLVVLDAEDRENEGDLVMAAQFAEASALAPFVRYGSGFICAPMSAERARRLRLPAMVETNEESMGTSFTVSVDAATGVTTGISAADRARTARLLAADDTRSDDLVRPGHLLPLVARPGGVRQRPGHTEATVDLLRLAGLTDVGLIVELVEDDGSMRRAESCASLAAELGAPVVTIEALRARLDGGAVPVQRVGSARLPTEYGTFTAHSYRDAHGTEHVALLADAPAAGDPLVRVHSECLTGDSLGSLRCDCGPQLREALTRVGREGGCVVHLGGQEGRGMGLAAKIAAYGLQDEGLDTVDANVALGHPIDSRTYTAAAAILRDLGLGRVRLLTNNPDKASSLRDAGIEVTEKVGLQVPVDPAALDYLWTKRTRMGHEMDVRSRGAAFMNKGVTI